MRALTVTMCVLSWACIGSPALAEEVDRVVAGLNYRVADGGSHLLAQAVRVRRDTGAVLVRYANAQTAWVDASRLSAYRQPVSTDAGPYLFVAAALACLLDEQRCVRPDRVRSRTVSSGRSQVSADPADAIPASRSAR